MFDSIILSQKVEWLEYGNIAIVCQYEAFNITLNMWVYKYPLDTMPSFKKILVGIDGSQRSYKAASYAAELADKYGAKITLMYVASGSTYPDRFAAKPTYVPNQDILTGEIFDPARKILEDKGISFDTAMELGNPAQLLLDRSKNEYDLIVVGAKGVSGIQGFLMGSVSSRVVQHSQVPVLVVP